MVCSESERTIKRPPMTERFRRKKDMSKMRPYPKPAESHTLARLADASVVMPLLKPRD